jgi:hypothetical protein
MKAFTLLLLLVSNIALAQNSRLAQFAFWKPKEGQDQQFETGYKQHLNWHRTNGDKWSWYGWFVISGPRDGQFIDATFNHYWSDFDKPIKPAEDGADNRLHTYPFGDFQAVLKTEYLPELSIADSNGLKSKYLRLITLSLSDFGNGLKVVEKLKAKYQSANLKSLMTYKVMDGSNINQLLLLLGFNSYEEFGKAEGLQEEISSIETGLKFKAISNISSETLVFRPDMSYFPPN